MLVSHPFEMAENRLFSTELISGLWIRLHSGPYQTHQEEEPINVPTTYFHFGRVAGYKDEAQINPQRLQLMTLLYLRKEQQPFCKLLSTL